MAEKQGVLFLHILHDEQSPVYLFFFFQDNWSGSELVGKWNFFMTLELECHRNHRSSAYALILFFSVPIGTNAFWDLSILHFKQTEALNIYK